MELPLCKILTLGPRCTAETRNGLGLGYVPLKTIMWLPDLQSVLNVADSVNWACTFSQPLVCFSCTLITVYNYGEFNLFKNVYLFL